MYAYVNQLESISCRYDTCYTQYAPDFTVAYCVCRVHNMAPSRVHIM